MDVDNQAASGPDTGNTGSNDPLDDALDKALAAFGGADGEGGDLPPQMVQAKLEEERKAKTTDAGDKSGSEDAAAAPGKVAKAPDANAAPQGNAPIASEAPKHWPEDRRKAFAGLPTEAQTALLALSKDLESGFTRKSQELSDQAKFAENVRGLFDEQTRQQLAHAGLDEVGGIRYLMGLQSFATRDPVGYIKWAMQQFGMTPDHLGLSPATRAPAVHQQHQQHQQQAPSITGDPKLDALLADPATAQLRTELGQFTQQTQQQLQAMQNYLAAQEQQRQAAEHQRRTVHVQGLQKQWQDFRSAQDDHGQLRYPHADVLAQQIGAIMETDPTIARMPDSPAKLDKAYEAALWARPDLRSTLLEQERAKATEAAQKAAEANRAKTVARVKPATGAPTMPAKKGGLDGAMEAAWAQLGGS